MCLGGRRSEVDLCEIRLVCREVQQKGFELGVALEVAAVTLRALHLTSTMACKKVPRTGV
jgi:hypothetical protein